MLTMMTFSPQDRAFAPRVFDATLLRENDLRNVSGSRDLKVVWDTDSGAMGG